MKEHIMKVALYSTYDRMGGAAVSFLRLVKSLRKLPVETYPIVQIKSTDYDFIKSYSGLKEKLLDRLVPKLEHFLLGLFYKGLKKSKFSTSLLINYRKLFKGIPADIVHLHWVGHGFVNIRSLKKIRKPVVITLHDMLAFTGGCYHSSDCERYQAQCGECPVLASEKKNDISRFILSSKIKNWSDLSLTIIAPSTWMAERAKKSSVFRNCNVVTIPNCIDTEIFKPVDKLTARRILNLPAHKKILLFGAVSGTANSYKGFDLLKKSFDSLNKRHVFENIHLVIFGQSRKTDDELEYACSYLGVLQDEYTLSIMYSAADLFLAPSREDNLPNTIMESLSCGTPVVAYKTGGIPDLVKHQSNGYLAAPLDYLEFAKGIIYCLENEERMRQLSCNARKIVMENFTEESVAGKHFDLYNKILKNESYARR